jgi:hypothetical protein
MGRQRLARAAYLLLPRLGAAVVAQMGKHSGAVEWDGAPSRYRC